MGAVTPNEVRKGSASWCRGDVLCEVKGETGGFHWAADRFWVVAGKPHQLRMDGEARTFFLAIRAAQRASDYLGRRK